MVSFSVYVKHFEGNVRSGWIFYWNKSSFGSSNTTLLANDCNILNGPDLIQCYKNWINKKCDISSLPCS